MRGLVLFLFLGALLFSAEFGKVVKVVGDVFVGDKKLEKNSKVLIGDTIVTNKKSMVLIKFGANTIVVSKNSELTLTKEDLVEQKKGEAFYDISPLKSITKGVGGIAPNKFKIKIKTATIGIRGTDFIVKTEDVQGVFLRGGELAVEAIEEEFNIYKQRELEEFEKFKVQMNQEFADYKKDLLEGFKSFIASNEFEISETKKEFGLQSGKMVMIDDQDVYHHEMNDDIFDKFSEYEQFIEQQ